MFKINEIVESTLNGIVYFSCGYFLSAFDTLKSPLTGVVRGRRNWKLGKPSGVGPHAAVLTSALLFALIPGPSVYKDFTYLSHFVSIKNSEIEISLAFAIMTMIFFDAGLRAVIYAVKDSKKMLQRILDYLLFGWSAVLFIWVVLKVLAFTVLTSEGWESLALIFFFGIGESLLLLFILVSAGVISLYPVLVIRARWMVTESRFLKYVTIALLLIYAVVIPASAFSLTSYAFSVRSSNLVPFRIAELSCKTSENMAEKLRIVALVINSGEATVIDSRNLDIHVYNSRMDSFTSIDTSIPADSLKVDFQIVSKDLDFPGTILLPLGISRIETLVHYPFNTPSHCAIGFHEQSFNSFLVKDIEHVKLTHTR